MQSVTASAVTASFVPPVVAGAISGGSRKTQFPRYTIGVTLRQEEMILDECRRRKIGFTEMVRRILDGWVERKMQAGGER